MTRVYTEEQKQRRRDLQKKCRQTDEYRAKARAYEQSRKHLPHVKEATKRYNSRYITSETYLEKQRIKFKCPKERAKALYQTVKQRATKRQIAFDLSIEWFEERLITGLCEVSKIPFKLDNYGEKWDKFYSPSVDRIDNDKGYVVENCRLVLFGFNAGKFTATDDDFAKLVYALVAQNFGKKREEPLVG